MDYTGSRAFFSIKLQTVCYRVRNAAISRYLDRLQKTIVIFTCIGYGIDITGNMDNIGCLPLFSVKLQAIHHRICNLAITGYLYRLQKTIITITSIGNSIDIIRDNDYAGSRALFSVKLQAIHYRVRNVTGSPTTPYLIRGYGDGRCHPVDRLA